MAEHTCVLGSTFHLAGAQCAACAADAAAGKPSPYLRSGDSERAIEARRLLTDLCDMRGTLRGGLSPQWFDRLHSVLSCAIAFVSAEAAPFDDGVRPSEPSRDAAVARAIESVDSLCDDIEESLERRESHWVAHIRQSLARIRRITSAA